MPDANANPERRFFVDLITRDISLEDAILDLIDNAVDSLMRIKRIDPYQGFLGNVNHIEPRAEITINVSTTQFKIEDNCGGISFESAKNDVFRFGHPDPQQRLSLSVFGIGLKRAIFKIGRLIQIESHSSDSGFYMKLNVDDWLKDQTSDWKMPLEKKKRETDPSKAGTKITITQLKQEIAEIAKEPAFLHRLIAKIKRAYPFYLGKYIDIVVNGEQIKSEDLSFAQSQNIKPAIESWEDDNVKITLICGFLPREKDIWTFDNSGWYIVCNGRVVVYADKSQLTGWGWKGILPLFMPKNRGFLGIVFFSSNHPESLPWDTTKRNIDSGSEIFNRARKKMVVATRSVIQYQDKMYRSNDDAEPREEYRDSINDLRAFSATKQAAEESVAIGKNKPQLFFFNPPENKPKMANIRFQVKAEELDRAKRRLGSISMPHSEVGKRIFKYFMDRECPK